MPERAGVSEPVRGSAASSESHVVARPRAASLTGIRLLLLASVVIWGWTFVAIKILREFVDPFELVGLRFGIGLPILYAVIRWKKIPIRFDAREAKALAIGAALISYHFVVQPFGIALTTATNTSWIIAITPLVLACLSAWILKERIGRAEIVGIAVATAGIVLLISRGDFTQLWGGGNVGDWLILSTAGSWALYSIATRDLSRSRPSLAVTLVVFTPLTLVCLGYIALHTGVDVVADLSPKAWVSLVFLGTLGTLAQWFWQEGVARLGAAKAGIFLYLEPLATTALAVPLLHESFGILSAIGGALVLAGVWWAERRGR